jgi:hypothetical protein
MTSQPVPFFVDGPCEDIGYRNTRDHPHSTRHKEFAEGLWTQFHRLADPHFREDARTHFLQRFWEMYLAVTLLNHGFSLCRHGDEGPEFYAPVGNRRIWFEAMAPGPGNGLDQVPQLVFGEMTKVPTEQILLRFTNALDTKHKRYDAALAKGIISPEDSYVLAINSRGIRQTSHSSPMPRFIQAFLPFGQPAVEVDVNTFEQKDSFYEYRPVVPKQNGSLVSTRAFLDAEACFCSAILHSTVDCANHPDYLGGDFSILHNPKAQHPIDAAIFSWCEQFTFQDEHLHRSSPHTSISTDLQ